VLDAMIRQGVNVPFSCRSGICQVCLQRRVNGEIPISAQRGLRANLVNLGYFMPCRCIAETDLEFEPPRPEDLYTPALVQAKEVLTPTVCRILLEPATNFIYRAGQFLNLRRTDGLVRSYSLASVPDEDYFLELHVKRMRNGAMSSWLFDSLQVGDELQVQGPDGQSYYQGGNPAENLLLIGSGTGLAPLLGIARDALRSGHTGTIHLYHGAREPSELYLRNELLKMCGDHPNFRYTACVRGNSETAGTICGEPHEVAFTLHPDLGSWRLHLAGPEQMVTSAAETARRAHRNTDRIHSDPFAYKDLRQQRSHRPDRGDVKPATAVIHGTRKNREPDPEMWAALHEGELLTTILTDFYTRVFDDPRLAPYFRGVTKRRLIEKVYSFMCQLFTGKKVFFGDRPRNAHHWMVISDELFDYREMLMVAVLRDHGLPDHLIRRWQDIEESFRRDIVKDQARVKVMAGVEMPLDGFGELKVTVGTLCDGCAAEIQPGETVRYHRRIGSTYCRRCFEPLAGTGGA